MLLIPEDREKVIRYIGQHIASECNLELPVRPVSVLPSQEDLLDRWFAEQILPLYSRSQELRAASLRRKIGALRESVIAALQLDLRRVSTLLHAANAPPSKPSVLLHSGACKKGNHLRGPPDALGSARYG